MRYAGKLVCLIFGISVIHVAQAETIEDLIAAGELEARIVIKTPEPHFQKAPIVFAVEVGTSRWFKRGTRVRDFTIPGCMVRPVSKFAFNETRRRGGDTWSFQNWSFQLFSERTGNLSTPELTTFISVDTELYGVVEGEISLQIPPLKITAPPGTEGLESWVAANEFKVEESWEGVLENYQIGDAITRIRRFTIKGAPAMAIPASPPIKLDGVQIYQAPALVDDKAVRGVTEGTREEREIFTLESGGYHTVPAHSIHWFNVNTKTIEKIDFKSMTFDVEHSSLPKIDDSIVPEIKIKPLLYGLLAIICTVLSYLLARLIGRTSRYQHVHHHLIILRIHRRAQKDFMSAANQQDSRRCLELLYKRMSDHTEWQLSTVCATNTELSAIADTLMAHAYGEGKAPETNEIKKLWKGCTKPKINREVGNTLRLNPGSSWERNSWTNDTNC